MERVTLFAVHCQNPAKVSLELVVKNGQAVQTIPHMDKSLIKTCPRIGKEVEVSADVRLGVAVSVSCTNIGCRFHSEHKG